MFSRAIPADIRLSRRPRSRVRAASGVDCPEATLARSPEQSAIQRFREVIMNMSVIGWIVLGLIAGIIAKSLLGGRAKHGVIVTILIGIAGALVGGWAASELFDIKATGGFFDLSTWLIAIVGSVALLLIYHLVTSGRRTRRRSGRKPGRRSRFGRSRR